MKAVTYNKKGSPQKLKFGDVDKPVPQSDELLIRVYSVGLNAADYRSMKMGIIPKTRIFGADISGVVESVGRGISEFKPGDEVIGDLAGCGFGGLAEFAVAPERLIAPKPELVSFEEAAALPMAAVTALQALRDKGSIQEGHRVLVIGSGGGVGTFTIQLARYFGAKVDAICSARNLELTKSLGADNVFDYQLTDIRDLSSGYDLIALINGNYSLSACKKLLRKNGVLVVVGGALPQIFKTLVFGRLMSAGSKKMRLLSARPNAKDLEFVASLAREKRIKPVIDRTYPLENVAEAMEYLSAGHARGKVVIQVINPATK